MDQRDEFDGSAHSPPPHDPLQPIESPIVPPPVIHSGDHPTQIPYYAHPYATIARWDAAPFPPIDQPQLRALVDLLAVIALMVAFAVYSFEYDLSERIAERIPTVGAFGWVFVNGLVAMAGVLLFVGLRGQSLRSLGLCRSPWRRLLPIVVAAAPVAWATGVACNLTYVVIQLLRGVSIESMMRHRLGFISAISEIDMRWVAPLAIFVGVYEEIFFRGFVMGRLASITRSRAAAVILSSLMFGAVHYTQGWLGVFQTTCLGAVLAMAAVLGRSLWASILAHAAIDGFSLAASVLMRSEISDMLHGLTTTQTGA